jgi:hypothetical protein
MICFAGYVGGCSVSSDDGPPPEPELKRDSPEGLMAFLSDAYERQDIDKYDESLHDEFLFTFTSKDAELIGLPEDEPWWGKTSDVSAARTLFEEPTVTKIEMDLARNAGPWPTEDGVGYRLEPTIRVTVEPPDATEPTVYLVNASWFDVEIVEDPYDEELWVFKGIQETLKEGLLAAAGE